jgi:hypothetical protein
MEEEARTLLRAAPRDESIPGGDLAEAIHVRSRRLGGVKLRPPVREAMHELPKPGR